MSDLRELYQETILDHGRRPRNERNIEAPSHRAEGFNPLCGDRVSVFLKLDEETDTVSDLSFVGSGCAISQASASLLTETLVGKTKAEAESIRRDFHRLLTGQPGEPPDPEIVSRLGKLAVFSGVCDFPARVKCATLAWHTLEAALEGSGESVSTE